jgi:hypothetical protein
VHDDPEVVAGFGAGAGRGGEAGMVPCGAVGRWPIRSTAPSGLSPAYANGLASALSGTGDTVAVSREAQSPVPDVTWSPYASEADTAVPDGDPGQPVFCRPAATPLIVCSSSRSKPARSAGSTSSARSAVSARSCRYESAST